MNKKPLLLPILFIIMLLAAGPIAAQTTERFQATLTVPEGELTVGDPIELTISVIHPSDHQVVPPQFEETWGDLVVRDLSAPTTVDNGDGTKTTTLVLDARLFAPGTVETPPLSITVADGTGQINEVAVPSRSITISSVLVEGDADLRDIKPQAELPFATLWPWIVGGLLVAFVAGAGALLWRARRRRLALALVDNRLPHEKALDELDRIGGLKLPESGRFKEHYTLVSECIRLYVGQIYDIPVIERTTAEIQTSLKATAIKPAVASNFLAMLDESDLVKFSKFKPDVTSAREIVLLGRQIVEDTKPVLAVEAAEEIGVKPPSDPTFSANGKYHHSEVSA